MPYVLISNLTEACDKQGTDASVCMITTTTDGMGPICGCGHHSWCLLVATSVAPIMRSIDEYGAKYIEMVYLVVYPSCRFKATPGSLCDAKLAPKPLIVDPSVETLPRPMAPTRQSFGSEIDLAYCEKGDMNDGITIIVAYNQQGNRAWAVLFFVSKFAHIYQVLSHLSGEVMHQVWYQGSHHDAFTQDLNMCCT
jgi:hypothetical protein